MNEPSSTDQEKKDSSHIEELSLAEGLQRVLDGADGDRIEMRRFFYCFQEKGFGILLMMFALPSALPLPAPGYSIPFGIVLALLAGQVLMGRHTPWLPERMLRVSFKRSFLEKLIPAGVAFLSKTKVLVRPRLEFFTGRLMQILPLLFVILMATFMMIPIPGTNTAPAMVIFMIGMGLSERDGLILCLSSLAGIGATFVTVFIIQHGKEALKSLLGMG